MRGWTNHHENNIAYLGETGGMNQLLYYLP